MYGGRVIFDWLFNRSMVYYLENLRTGKAMKSAVAVLPSAILAVLLGCAAPSAGPASHNCYAADDPAPRVAVDRSKWRWLDRGSETAAADNPAPSQSRKSSRSAGSGWDFDSFFAVFSTGSESEPGAPPADANLIVNGGFELGTAGYDCIRYLRPDTNAQLRFDPPEIDYCASGSGNAALRLTHRFAEQTQLIASELKLKPRSQYRFSVKLKSDVPDQPVNIVIKSVKRFPRSRPQISAHNAKFTAGPAWKEFTLDFVTGNAELHQLEINTNSNRETASHATIWIDDLKLAEPEPPAISWLDELMSESTADQPWFSLPDEQPDRPVSGGRIPGNIGAAFTAEREIYLSDAADFSVSGQVANTTDSSGNFRLTLELQDDFHHRFCVVAEVSGTLNAGESRHFNWRLPLPPAGAYTLIPRLETKQLPVCSIPGYFAVVHALPARNVPPGSGFCLAFNSGTAGYIFPETPQENTGFRAKGLNADEYYRRLALAGTRTLREWGGNRKLFFWSTIERRKGHFDFSVPDLMVKIAGRHHINFLPVLGGMEFLTSLNPPGFNSMPEWVINQSARLDNMPPDFKRINTATRLPPLSLWRRYVREVVRHYRDRIIHFEIMQEPNAGGGDGWMPPPDYLRYLQAAAEEIRRASPRNRVIGFGLTGALHGDPLHYLGRSLEAGALEWVDIVSFHPYQARELQYPEKPDADAADFIAELRRTLASAHPRRQDREVPLWNTELEYLFDYPEERELRQIEYLPRHLVRRLLTDAGEGVAFSSPVAADSLFRRTVLSNHLSFDGINRTACRPSAGFVACNVLSRYFEGARPFKKFRGTGVVAYLFQVGPDQYAAAAWRMDNSPPRRIPWNFPPAAAAVIDLMGAPVATTGAGLELQEDPIYILWNSPDPSPLETALSALTHTNAPPDRP